MSVSCRNTTTRCTYQLSAPSTIKRHANLITNTWSKFERSVIVDAVGDSLDSLSGTPGEPYMEACVAQLQQGLQSARNFTSLGSTEKFA